MFDTLGPDGWRVALFDDWDRDLPDGFEVDAFVSLVQPRIVVIPDDPPSPDVYPDDLGPWVTINGHPINGVHGDNPRAIRQPQVTASDDSGTVLTTSTLLFNYDPVTDTSDDRLVRVVLSSRLSDMEKKALREEGYWGWP